MRRAIRPAICTQVTSAPPAVRSQSALRSFSSDALSSAALTKAPGKYQRSFTTPSTGARLECTLNTFMKTLIFSASRFRYGSWARPTMTMRPSAGDTTARGSSGTSRAGSRKNCSTNRVASQSGSDHQPMNQLATAETTIPIARNGQPSRAMIGCGYGGRTLLLVLFQALRALPLLHEVTDFGGDAVDRLLRLLADALRSLRFGDFVAASRKQKNRG